ncbi:hypothetical protein WG78_19355 [Amantichitinum ursilacus]|uniref:Uncharacterized protein n=1 Tax=Amantichitinum ursilacus TaxID=857265 RepID=A0A0N0XI62_9NEIS|nr:hypothetical protein WG78_19355 [Amantichitinum ursilacus]
MTDQTMQTNLDVQPVQPWQAFYTLCEACGAEIDFLDQRDGLMIELRDAALSTD